MDWPGEKVFTRLIDLLENTAGGFLRPWQIRRVEGANSEARARERLILAQAERDILDIKSGKKYLDSSGKLLLNSENNLIGGSEVGAEGGGVPEDFSPPFESLIGVARDNIYIDEVQKSINLKKILLFSEEEAEHLDNINSVSSKKDDSQFDNDWFSKWQNEARNISKEEVQRLWARLLAGEINNPGSYSFRTINFLANISTGDIEIISKISPFITGFGVVKIKDNFFEEKNIKFSDILIMQEMGILNGVDAIGLNYELNFIEHNNMAVSTLTCNNKGLIFILGPFSTSLKKIEFPIYGLTKLGKEIISLAKFEANDAYLKEIANMSIENGATEVQLANYQAGDIHLTEPKTIARK
ncbi:DUF2806 domain-containing protein [Oceanibaculum nanhaiense]|uniref:DUF2806 domain-containing protein n=1 Tax=Oceanibaculum nanhaiense TaxID=1909734 RepID=UPI00396D4007